MKSDPSFSVLGSKSLSKTSLFIYPPLVPMTTSSTVHQPRSSYARFSVAGTAVIFKASVSWSVAGNTNENTSTAYDLFQCNTGTCCANWGSIRVAKLCGFPILIGRLLPSHWNAYFGIDSQISTLLRLGFHVARISRQAVPQFPSGIRVSRV